ncbi:MAG: hypothetical protein U5K54_18295 [Cytophagales bacterium]|nr:hypothetical protein [Cytophagales bacterium]
MKAYALANTESKANKEESKLSMIKAMKGLREVEQYFAFPGNEIFWIR